MPSLDETPQDLVGCLHQNAENFADNTCLHVLGDNGGAVDNITYSELWLKYLIDALLHLLKIQVPAVPCKDAHRYS